MLDMWDLVLNESDVTKLWNSCEKYHGNLVAWAQMRQYIHGDIVVIIIELQSFLSFSDLAITSHMFSDFSQPVLSRLSLARGALQR